ncbi:MAG: DUF423 domain-containing protein [Micropepsaceae bacterium]
MFRFWLAAGALNMLVALAVGAATGHALQGEFVPVVRQILDTAREMHFVHSLALISVGIVSVQFGGGRLLNLAGFAFLVGIICFCGGIYAAFGPGAAAVKPLIPVGGVAFMCGWVLFAAASAMLRRP